MQLKAKDPSLKALKKLSSYIPIYKNARSSSELRAKQEHKFSLNRFKEKMLAFRLKQCIKLDKGVSPYSKH